MRNLFFILILTTQLHAQETAVIFVSPSLTSFNDNGKIAVTYSSLPYLAEITHGDTLVLTDSVFVRWFITCDGGPNPQYEMLETHEDTIYLDDSYWKIYSTADHYPKRATTYTPLLEVNPGQSNPLNYEVNVYDNPSSSQTMRLYVESNMPYKVEYFNHIHHFPMGGWYEGTTDRQLWVYHRGVYYLRVRFKLPCGQIKEVVETLYFNP